MDDATFDRLTRKLGAYSSRRSLVARALGIGAGAAIATQTLHDASAARRGFTGPKLPCRGPRCEARCQVTADCPPCQCTSQRGIQCSGCTDIGTCFTYRYDCDGCCETVDDVGVCACNS